MSGDKGEFKGKARSSSQAGPNIPAQVTIQWYGMWKRESKDISHFINERTPKHAKYNPALKMRLGSQDVTVCFKEGDRNDFEPPKKVISILDSAIMYVFYDASDEPSFKAADKFIREQFSTPASNPSEKTARKNIYLVEDRSWSHDENVVDVSEGEHLKNYFGIQFYRCSSVNDIQKRVTKSLKEYVISVSSPDEVKKITTAKKVMEDAYKEISALSNTFTYQPSPQWLLNALKRLAAARESIGYSKAHYLDSARQKEIEDKLCQLESSLLEPVRLVAVAGGPACPSELYYSYVDYCEVSGYWERQFADCLKEIEDSERALSGEGRLDAKASTGKNVEKAVAAYAALKKLLADLQTIANNCATLSTGVRRFSQSGENRERLEKIKSCQRFCVELLSKFFNSIQEKVKDRVIENLINSVKNPNEASLESIEKYTKLKEACFFFDQVIPQSLDRDGLEWQAHVAVESSVALLSENEVLLVRSYSEYLANADKVIKDADAIKEVFSALEKVGMKDVVEVRGKIITARNQLSLAKIKIDKYKKLYNDRAVDRVEKGYAAACKRLDELADQLVETEKAIKSQEVLVKTAEDLLKIEVIEKDFSALGTLDEVRGLQEKAKAAEADLLSIQNRIEVHQKLYGNGGLEQIVTNHAKAQVCLKLISDKLNQIIIFDNKFKEIQASLQPLSGKPALEEISKFIDKSRGADKDLSSIDEELEGWPLGGKGSPLYLQLKKTLPALKEEANGVITAAKIKFMALSYTKLLKTLSEVPEAKALEEQCQKISQAEQLKNRLAELQITDISSKTAHPVMVVKAKEGIVKTMKELIFPYTALLNELSDKVVEVSTIEGYTQVFNQMEEVSKNLIKIQQASLEASEQIKVSIYLEQGRYIAIQLTEKMKKLVKAKYGGVLNDSIIKVSTIDGCCQAINQIRKVKEELEAFQQQYSAVSELIGIANYLKQAEILIVQALENTKEAVRAEYMGKRGDMSDIFRSHGSGEIMTTPILYANGHSYNKDDKPKADESEIKQVARNRPLESLLNLYKPKKIESGASEDKSAGSRESKTISFDQAVYFITCPLEAAIIRKPVMAIIINGEEREGRVYENSKQALGLKVETETGAEIVDRFHGNHALESFTKVLFEQYPDELESLLKNDWGVNKENAVEIVKWLVSLRIDFATKETYIASVYEKSGLTAEQLGRECGRVQDAVGQSAVSTVHDRLVLLINIQKDELPYLRRLVAQAKQAGRTEENLNNIKEGEIIIEYLTSNVDMQIRDIILDNAARYQKAAPLQVSPPKDNGQQAPSSVSSSLFYHVGSKEDDKSVALQHSGDGQQIPATVSSSHVTTFSGSNVAPPLPAGDSSHFSSSTDQLPAGNSLNN